ncbi:MAG TPA: flagellar hook-length control protein FliK [Candidatus Mediterraneibacter merdavium]|nr:flagellar hook-length control protein FliK [Candidatus Mediterraneibacter merdavium]
MDMIMQNMMMQQPAAMAAGNELNAGQKGQAADGDSDMFAQMMEAAGAMKDSQTDDADPADSLVQSMASQYMQATPLNMIMARLSEAGSLAQTGVLSGVFGISGTAMQPENMAADMMSQNMQAGTVATPQSPVLESGAEAAGAAAETMTGSVPDAAGFAAETIAGAASGSEAEASLPASVHAESHALKEKPDADKAAVQPLQKGSEDTAGSENVQVSARQTDSGQTELSGGKQTAMADAGAAESREMEKNSRVSGEQTEQIQFNPSSATSVEKNAQVQQKTDTSPVLRFSSANQTENMQKLSELIKNAVDSSVKELEIQLEPANLGKIILKATYEAGKAAVVISCTNSGTLEALSRHAAELGGLIQDHMGGQTEIVIDQPQQQYLNQDGRNGGQDTREEQREQHERQKNRPAQGDFLEQLRLGLV